MSKIYLKALSQVLLSDTQLVAAGEVFDTDAATAKSLLALETVRQATNDEIADHLAGIARANGHDIAPAVAPEADAVAVPPSKAAGDPQSTPKGAKG